MPKHKKLSKESIKNLYIDYIKGIDFGDLEVKYDITIYTIKSYIFDFETHHSTKGLAFYLRKKIGVDK